MDSSDSNFCPFPMHLFVAVHISKCDQQRLFFPAYTCRTYPVYEKYTSSSSGFSAGSMDTG